VYAQQVAPEALAQVNATQFASAVYSSVAASNDGAAAVAVTVNESTSVVLDVPTLDQTDANAVANLALSTATASCAGLQSASCTALLLDQSATVAASSRRRMLDADDDAVAAGTAAAARPARRHRRLSSAVPVSIVRTYGYTPAAPPPPSVSAALTAGLSDATVTSATLTALSAISAVTIESASLDTSAAATASTVETALAAALPGVSVTVEQEATLFPPSPPPPPLMPPPSSPLPSPPPSPSTPSPSTPSPSPLAPSGDSGLDGGGIAAIVAGSVVIFLVLVIGGVFIAKESGGKGDAGVYVSGTQGSRPAGSSTAGVELKVDSV